MKNSEGRFWFLGFCSCLCNRKQWFFSRASSCDFSLMWAVWAIKNQPMPCLCVQLGLLNTLLSLFLEAGPGAKHLVIKGRLPEGKHKEPYSPINTCPSLEVTAWTGVSMMFFHCCPWMIIFDLLSTNFFWKVLQRWALWFICVQLS